MIAVAVVVLVIIGIVALALRSRDSDGRGAAQSASPSSTTGPQATVASTSASSTQSTTASSASATLDRCHTSQLAAAFVSTQGAAGSSIGTFSLTNTSSSTCTLLGFPGIALTDDAGHEVVPPPERNGAIPASKVTLTSGQHATFAMRWENDVNGTGCFDVSRVVITPPDETDSITIPAVDTDGAKLEPCGSGATSVQVVRAA
jgi:hypothetical protein